MPPQTPATLLDRLLKEFPTAKRQILKQMLQAGRVRINGLAARRLSQAVTSEDRVEILNHSRPRAAKPTLPFPVIYEDRDILVIDKPAGLLTSTVPRETRPTALAIVRQYVAALDRKAKVGLVHRLDRDASGLLIFSKNPQAHESLKRQFYHHTVTRIYIAQVSPPPKHAIAKIQSHLIERADGTVHSTYKPHTGQRAITEYTTMESDKKTALLRVQLQTGRKHQIRVHLSEAGSPVMGDTVYHGLPAPDLMLSAIELHIDHPRTAARQILQIPPPSRFPAKNR